MPHTHRHNEQLGSRKTFDENLKQKNTFGSFLWSTIAPIEINTSHLITRTYHFGTDFPTCRSTFPYGG
jgi:hypothetical protein